LQAGTPAQYQTVPIYAGRVLYAIRPEASAPAHRQQEEVMSSPTVCELSTGGDKRFVNLKKRV